MNATEQNNAESRGSEPQGAQPQGTQAPAAGPNPPATGQFRPAMGASQPAAGPYQPMGSYPPAPPQHPVTADAGNGQRPERRHGWIGIVATILGVILLIGYFTTSLVSGLWGGNNRPFTDQQTAPASETVLIDVAYGQIDIDFSDDATEASFDVTGRSQAGESPITLSSSGSELVLQSRDTSPWFRGGPWGGEDFEVVGVLTLPASLERTVDLTIEIGAGSVTVNGVADQIDANIGAGELIVNERFETGEFAVGVGRVVLQEGGANAEINADAGEAEVLGAYDNLTATVDVGRLSFEGTVRDRAEVVVEAGNVDLTFVETMPRETRVETSVGDINIAMPDIPVQLDGPRTVREDAERSGYEINGGADAPQVLVIVEFGDVSFR